MVSDGSLSYAKIDRPKGIINFDKRKPSEEVRVVDGCFRGVLLSYISKYGEGENKRSENNVRRIREYSSLNFIITRLRYQSTTKAR